MLHDSQTDLVFLPMALRLHFPSLYKSLTEAFETSLGKGLHADNSGYNWRHGVI